MKTQGKILLKLYINKTTNVKKLTKSRNNIAVVLIKNIGRYKSEKKTVCNSAIYKFTYFR